MIGSVSSPVLRYQKSTVPGPVPFFVQKEPRFRFGSGIPAALWFLHKSIQMDTLCTSNIIVFHLLLLRTLLLVSWRDYNHVGYNIIISYSLVSKLKISFNRISCFVFTTRTVANSSTLTATRVVKGALYFLGAHTLLSSSVVEYKHIVVFYYYHIMHYTLTVIV